MASFDNVVNKYDNFKGYIGNPPTTTEEYNALDCWKDPSIKPSWNTISVNMNLENISVLRKNAYPLMEDYLDGIVKNDQAQVDKYIADCLAVKAQYPKGSE